MNAFIKTGFKGERLMLKILMAVALMALIWCNPGWSQTYPERTVRIVVGFGPGGPDTTARVLAAQLTSQTKQTFFVENRPGASGTIGAEMVAKAKPDGYTLLAAPNSFASTQSMFKTLPYDLVKDFTPISHYSSSESAFLCVNTSLPVKNLKELLAYARKPESKLSYGSAGVGSGLHLRGASFNAKSGLHMVHVPYKDAGSAITGLMSGEIQVSFVTTTVALPLIKSGKIRALAYDYDTRAEFLPEVPTMDEAGATETGIGSGWHGLFAPAKTPAAIVTRLESEVHKAVTNPEVKQQFIKLGLIPEGSTSAQFQILVAKTVKSMSEAVHAAGIQPQ
jgi:tripartite-type tricarboxylate transporter receptor subunit TctC